MSLNPMTGRPAAAASAWWLFVVLGLIWMILGLLAIAEPYVAADIAVTFFGVILTIGGVL